LFLINIFKKSRSNNQHGVISKIFEIFEQLFYTVVVLLTKDYD